VIRNTLRYLRSKSESKRKAKERRRQAKRSIGIARARRKKTNRCFRKEKKLMRKMINLLYSKTPLPVRVSPSLPTE
jgi:hypothetical protein